MPKLDKKNNETIVISVFKVQMLLLMCTVSLSCCILRAFVPVSIAMTSTARPVCSNSQNSLPLFTKQWTMTELHFFFSDFIVSFRNQKINRFCPNNPSIKPKYHITALPLWSCSGALISAYCLHHVILPHFEEFHGGFLMALQERAKKYNVTDRH